MHVLKASCGDSMVGDELELSDWASDDSNATQVEFTLRLERCRKYVREQGDLIDESEGLQWNEPYHFWVAWFEIPSSAIESGESIEDVLPRVLSDDENVDEVLSWVRKAVFGTYFDGEEDVQEGEAAAEQILEELSQFYSG